MESTNFTDSTLVFDPDAGSPSAAKSAMVVLQLKCARNRELVRLVTGAVARFTAHMAGESRPVVDTADEVRGAGLFPCPCPCPCSDDVPLTSHSASCHH